LTWNALSGKLVDTLSRVPGKQANVRMIEEWSMPTSSRGGRTVPLWIMKGFWLLIAAVQIWGGLELLASAEPSHALLAVPGLLVWFFGRKNFFAPQVIEHSV